MVAHKIINLTNFKDQSKGGDGIFLGDYYVTENTVAPAIFIGEAKIMQGYSDALDDALGSLNRFHSPEVKSEFNAAEFVVARDTLMLDDDFEEMYDRLTPGTPEYRAQTMVHPILIMFNTARINTFETKATTAAQLEDFIKKYMQDNRETFFQQLQEKLESYSEVKKVFIDLFLFPFNDIDKFRNGMYYNIHGVPYKSPVNGS